MSRADLTVVLDAAGIPAEGDHIERLETYAEWLADEAVRAGGIGPNEVERLWNRHIVDAAAYAIVADGQPTRFVDVGTGVGLPGLVLAILWPASAATLIDRAGRRVDLVRRASRVCGLSNVTVRQAAHTELDETWPLVVSRATLPVATVVRELAALIEEPATDHPGGVGVVGFHRGTHPPGLPPEVDGLSAIGGSDAANSGKIHDSMGAASKEKATGEARVVTIPEVILDPPAWFLKIQRRG